MKYMLEVSIEYQNLNINKIPFVECITHEHLKYLIFEINYCLNFDPVCTRSKLDYRNTCRPTDMYTKSNEATIGGKY